MKSRTKANPAQPRPSKRDYLFVAGAVLLVQLLQILWLRHDPSVTGPISDALDYHNEASHLAGGLAAPPIPNYLPPFFSWLLGATYLVLGTASDHGLFLQAFLSLIVAWEVLALARLTLDPKVALAAGLIASAYGPLLFFDGQLAAAPLDAALALGLLLVAIRTSGTSGLVPQALLGLMAGLAIATRGTVAPFVAFLFVRPFLLKGQKRLFTILRVEAIAVGLFVALLPVGIANWSRSGTFTLIPVRAGIDLWLGNNPHIAATTALRPGHRWDHMFMEAARNGARSLVEDSDYFRTQALSWMLHHPLDALLGFAMKLGELLNGLELPRILDPYGPLARTPLTQATLWHIPLLRFPFGVLLPFAVIGLILRWRDVDATRALVARMTVAFVALNALGICFFFPTGSDRLALELVLLASAVDGGLAIHRSLKGTLVINERVWLVAIGVAFWANVMPQMLGPHLENEARMQLALTHRSAHRWVDEQQEMEALLATRPDDADALKLLAEAMEKQEDQKGAITALEKAVELAPDYANAWEQLGALRIATRHLKQAVPAFEAAVRENPADGTAWGQLALSAYETSQIPDALRAAQVAVELDPARPENWMYLGAAQRDSGDPAHAVDSLSESLRRRPNSAAEHYHLALAMDALGRKTEALYEAKQASDRIPGHKIFQALVDRLQAEQPQ